MIYHACQISYMIKDKVEAEIICSVKKGVMEVVQFFEWATPIVPVLQKNGSVWFCGDYKQTVNQAPKLDTNPLLMIEDIFSSLTCRIIISKLDLNLAYLQGPLDESSKNYVTVNTHKGLFHYNRLPFGVSSTPSIFQRIMEKML